MSTEKITLTEDTWTLISNKSVTFQISDGQEVFAVQARSIPTADDTSLRQRITPGRIYSFRKEDGNLYLYSPNANTAVFLDFQSGISELGLNVDTYIQDQISDPLEFYLSRKINETNLTTSIPINTAGDPWEVTETETITLDDVTGVAAGLWIELWEGAFKFQAEIDGVAGSDVTLKKPIGFPFTTAAVVYLVDVDSNKDFTGTGIGPQYYTYDPPSIYTEDTHENRYMITMLHVAESDASLYGDQAELPNGIVYSGRGKTFTYETGLAADLVLYNNLFNVRRNEDYKSLAYDVSFEPRSGNPAAGNFYGTTVRKTFNGQDKSGVVIPVRQDRNEATRALFRDDLSGLELHRIRVVGHQVI